MNIVLLYVSRIDSLSSRQDNEREKRVKSIVVLYGTYKHAHIEKPKHQY